MGPIIHFGTDGWRARLDGDFTDENVIRIAAAAGSLWREGAGDRACTVYVGYDMRPDAQVFAYLAAEVLAGCGLDAILSERPAPTAALSYAAAHDAHACGALIVTGSHHPMDYLGIKLRIADGGTGTPAFYDELEDRIEPDATSARGSFRTADVITPYLAALPAFVDADAIRRIRPAVVLDPMYGAGRGCLAGLLRQLGVDVWEMHGAEEPGWEDLRPEPVEPWVDECERNVVELGADMGLIIGGDASRVGAVDELGRYVPPQKIITLVLRHLVGHRGLSGRVVANPSCSVMLRRAAEQLGCRLTVRPTGFKHIYEEMLRGNVLIGGEEAGGIGIPAHLPERDGMLCCLLLCELLAVSGRKLSELVDELDSIYGAMSYARRDIRLEPEIIEMLRTLLPGLNPPEVAGRCPVAVSHMDGLRFEFDDEAWLLLRPSGTEPVVRIYAEAPTIEERDTLLDAGSDLAREGI